MPVGDIMGLGNKPSLDVQPPILEKIIAQYHNIVGMTNRDGQKLRTYLIPNFSQGELVSLCGFGSFPATLEGKTKYGQEYIEMTPLRFSSHLIHSFVVKMEQLVFMMSPYYDPETGEISSISGADGWGNIKYFGSKNGWYYDLSDSC